MRPARSRSSGFAGKSCSSNDTPINQVVAREMLEFAGLDIVLARNGQEAVNLALTEPFDLILMDIEMPVMDGYEATRRIRQQERLKDLPIVAMTAHAMRGVRERCLAAGMNGHIAKPIDMPGLHATLRQWLPAREQSSVSNAAEAESPRLADGAADSGAGRDMLTGALPNIDTQAALERLGQKHALYRQLLQTFLHEHRATGPRVEAALAVGDFETAGKILHTLKGVSGNLGMMRLNRAAVVLEDALARGTWHPNRLDAFRSAFADVVSSLSGLFVEDSATNDAADEPSGQPDAQALPPLLTAFARHLREGSPRAADLLPELKAALGGTIPELMRALGDQINAFDFETAESTLQQLIRHAHPHLLPHLHLASDESPP
ncbi:MAG: response regulator [Propionivibrio sp.]